VEVSLEGKVALVTGVGPNIGSGVTLALARYGAKVACNDVSGESIDACIARVERNGGEAMAAPGDVTDEAAVIGYVNDVLAAWGRIDILVNNAALLGGGGVLDETAEAFQQAVLVSAMGRPAAADHAGQYPDAGGLRPVLEDPRPMVAATTAL
jgi:NAD(P)-dependent dehydrogenase (short-subunit alcohol dehydrogenase family)